MRKLAAIAGVLAIAAVGSAQAAKPPKKPHPAKPNHPATPHHPANCKLRSVDYRASGKLVSMSGGTIEVNITKANHHAAKGDQTFTLGTAKTKLHGFHSTTPGPGSKVKLRGRILIQTNRNCPNGTAAPTASSVTLKSVDINK